MRESKIYQLLNDLKKELKADYNRKSKADVIGHAANSQKIDENTESIFDEADVISENSETAFDLADYIAGLEERIEALENA